MMEYLIEPVHVKWYLTNRCNLRCKFCYLHEYQTPGVSYQEALKIIDLLDKKKISHVALLGGEPTEYKYFIDVIKELNKRNIKFSFSSNGIKISKNKELLKVISQLTNLESVQISIESPFEKTNDNVRGKGTFKKALLAVKKLKEEKKYTIVAMVLTKKNYKHIQEMISLCEELNVDELRIMPFIPLGTGESVKEELMLTFSQIKKILVNLNSNKIKINSYLNLTENTQKTFGCGAGTTGVVINSDLTLSACDLLTQSEKTKDTLIGNIEENFNSLWLTDPIFSEWRIGEYRKSTECNKCALFEYCGGYL